MGNPSFYAFHKFNSDISLHEVGDALISFQDHHINTVGISITDSKAINRNLSRSTIVETKL
jgi:hypothetical protein